MKLKINTLEYAENLQASGFTQTQASGLAKALTDVDVYDMYSANDTQDILKEATDVLSNNLNKQIRIIDKRCDELNVKFDKRCDALEEKFDKRCDALEEKFDKRCDALEEKFDKRCDALDARIDRIDEKLDSKFRWLAGIMVTVGLGLAGYFSTIIHLIR